jgi:hypothetical protein
MASHDPAEFLKLLAPHILAELRPPSDLKKFTRNTAVVGAYVEAAVRELVRRQVSPLHVASGAVIDQANIPGDPALPQIDTIVWAPSPAPAVFQVGEFGLVPRSSSFGVLEIKASAYNRADLDRRLAKDFIQRVTADPTPQEIAQLGDKVAGLGVICVRAKTQTQASIAAMKCADRVVVLFEEHDGDTISPRPKDIYRLVNFLGYLRLRGRLHEGIVGINLDLLR